MEKNNIRFEFENKKILVVFDLPQKLHLPKITDIPHDAQAEWESESTIEKIISTWKSLGFFVIPIPIDENFFNSWNKHVNQCSFVHSLVEGFGSLSREAWIPSLCELHGVPCVGSSPFAHSVCMSKSQTKLICKFLQIPTTEFYLIRKKEDFYSIPSDFLKQTHFIKPDAEGSGMGIDASLSISDNPLQTKKTIEALLPLYPDGILLEKTLTGEEYTSGLLGNPAEFLPIAKISVPQGVYGYAYKSKDKMEEEVTFPTLSSEAATIIQEGTIRLFEHLHMFDFVRMDWKCDEQGVPHFLEANTLAGLSYEYSVFPLMAKHAGYSYEQLFEKLGLSVLKRQNSRNLWYGQSRIKGFFQ